MNFYTLSRRNEPSSIYLKEKVIMQNKIVLVAAKNVWIFVSCHFFPPTSFKCVLLSSTVSHHINYKYIALLRHATLLLEI